MKFNIDFPFSKLQYMLDDDKEDSWQWY